MKYLLLPLLLTLLTLFTVCESVSVVEFSSGRYETHEGDRFVSLRIRRSGDIQGDITVEVILRDVTAKQGLDFGPFPAKAITIPVTLISGQKEFIFGVQIREDDEMDPGEIFKASLKIPRTQNRVVLGRERNAVITIVDRADATLPKIINTYRPNFDPSRGEVVITARNPSYTTTVTIMGQQPVDNPSLIFTAMNISCKAKGGPIATITWSRTDNNGNVMSLEEPIFSIFVPRPGRSVITIPLPAQQTACINYTCNATNFVGSVFGEVEVCPIYYDCTAGTELEDCIATCGLGLAQRRLNCVQQTNGVDSDINFMAVPRGLYTPPLETCNIRPCPVMAYEYDDQNYTECSRMCGRGSQTREVNCFFTVDGVQEKQVEISECVNFGAGPPVTQRECNDFPCPKWVINNFFGPCSSTCYGGIQERNVTCMGPVVDPSTDQVVAFSNALLNDSFCSVDKMPPRFRSCNFQIPCPHRWLASNWGPCADDNCQERSVACVQYDTSIPNEAWPVNDSFCTSISPRLPAVRSCQGGVCNRGVWSAPPFDQLDCPTKCGFGTHSRSVSCIDRKNSSVVFEAGFCDQNIKPAETEQCILRNCPGRCDFEPTLCRVLAILRYCKQSRFLSTAQQCCKSCPLQATPIPLLAK